MRAHSIAFLLLFYIPLIHANDGVVGIDGFVKESKDLQNLRADGSSGLDLSQVKVELYSQGGVRKYETECTPNGYYLMQVDETGTFVVKAKGLGGWSMKPTEVTVECTSKGCANGAEVNFEVEGFSVRGKIEGAAVKGCAGDNAKLNSITVNLKPAGSSSAGVSVKASASGDYVFNKVLPGNYILTASHPSWSLEGPKGGVPVTVGWTGVKVQEVIRIVGYHMSGKVSWKQQGVGNVEVLMYADSLDFCTTVSKDSKGVAVCLAKTSSEGIFQFSSVPCGKYKLVPRYDTGTTQFEVSPSSLEVSVGHGNAQLGSVFQIAGFSVGGKVKHLSTSKGVPGAKIKVNGKQMAVTDNEGNYKLSSMEDGEYSIEAFADNMKMQKLEKLQVDPTTKQIPDISVQEYLVSGSLVIDSELFSYIQPVSLTTPTSQKSKTSTDKSGNFKFWVPPGKYSIAIDVSDSDKSNGLVLGPKSREIDVTDHPILDIKFVQTRVSLKFHVRKLEGSSGWGTVVVEILGGDVSGARAVFGDAQQIRLGDVKMVEEGDGQLGGLFEDLVPGPYTLKISRKGWCWREEVLKVSLGEKDHDHEPFIQQGYVVQVSVSHDMPHLTFSGPGVEKGISKQYSHSVQHPVCFTSLGKHSVKASGCYSFGEAVEFDPAESSTVKISATHFTTKGTIKIAGPIPEDPITIEILNKAIGETRKVQGKVLDGEVVYNVKGAVGETLQIKPAKHSVLLFTPESRTVQHTGKVCQKEIATFNAKAGLFLTVSTQPAVEGASVVLVNGKGEDLSQGMTNANGAWKLGPLSDDELYDVKINKNGYEFTREASSKAPSFTFKSKKLSKVEVVVDVTGPDKEGVLVVLTGGDRYRKNGQTDKHGKVAFWNLPPAAYYVKPMLKEYNFEPQLHEVTVQDGKDEIVTFKARRTAFSVFGKITTLTDKAVEGATVEAVGPDDLSESATSLDNGMYRIRGLKPGLQYTISVVKVDGVERGWPEKQTVTLKEAPKENVDFVIFRSPATKQLTGVVNVDDAFVNKTLVEISKVGRGGGSKIVETMQLDVSRWFETSLGPGQYFVKAVAKSMRGNFQCSGDMLPVTINEQDKAEVYIGELDFGCSDKEVAGEESSGNRWPVLAAIVAVVAMQYRTKLQAVLSSLRGTGG